VPERGRFRAGGLAVVLLASLWTFAPSGAVRAECPAAGGQPIPEARDPVPRAQVVFRGHGLGHGLGMSQYGAQGAARLGCTASEILATYYQDTRVRGGGMPSKVTVQLIENARRAAVTRITGTIRWRNGGQLIHVQRSGTVKVRRIDATRAELRVGGVRVWAGRVAANGLVAAQRRGIVRLGSPTDTYGKLPMVLRWDRIVFRVEGAGIDVDKVLLDNGHGRAMDKYLLGLAEVPPTWPTHALRAQVIAARTYAFRRAGGLLPTVAHQNWNGYAYEAVAGDRWRNAVWATSGRVIVDGAGQPIDAFYSSSMAGYTEDKVYAWGGSPISYLHPVDDSQWTRASDNPASTLAWTRGFTREQVAGALGFQSVTRVFVYPRGDPRRAMGVRVTGIRNGRRVVDWVTGDRVRITLGLPSPGFVVRNNP
jgi:stage II sporulation SpoD-like protein